MKLSHFMYNLAESVTFWFSEDWFAEQTEVTAPFKKYPSFGGSLFTENLYALLWMLKVSKQEVDLLLNANGEISGFTFDVDGSLISLTFEPFVRLSFHGYNDPASDNLIYAEEVAGRIFTTKYAKDVCPF